MGELQPDQEAAIARDQARLRRNFWIGTAVTLALGFLAATWARWPTRKASEFPSEQAQPK